MLGKINVLASSFINHSIGRTMLSSHSVFKNVRLLLLDNYVEIDNKSRNVLIRELPKKVVDDNARYEEALLSWFLRWRGYLSCIANAESSEQKPIIDLSGGLDSRLVLSIAFPEVLKCNVDVFSQPSSSLDLSIAKSLGDTFGFDISSTPPNRKLVTISKQYERYLYGNLGFYHLPVSPIHSMGIASQFKVNGIGGEVIRDFYSGSGLEWLDKIKHFIPESLLGHYDGVRHLLESSYVDLNIDPSSKIGLREHYRQLRSRIHGGRRLYEKFKYSFISPLLDPSLQQLSQLPDAPSPSGIYRDILLLGGGEDLVLHSFDKENKNFDVEFIENSLFYRGKHSSVKSIGNECEYFEIGRGTRNDGVLNSVGESDFSYSSLQGAINGNCRNSIRSGGLDNLPYSLRNFYLEKKWEEAKGRESKINEVTWHSVLISSSVGS